MKKWLLGLLIVLLTIMGITAVAEGTSENSSPWLIKKVHDSDYTGNDTVVIDGRSISLGTGYNDVHDEQIKTRIDFEIITSVPANISDYKNGYFYQIVDQLDKGFDYNEEVVYHGYFPANVGPDNPNREQIHNKMAEDMHFVDDDIPHDLEVFYSNDNGSTWENITNTHGKYFYATSDYDNRQITITFFNLLDTSNPINKDTLFKFTYFAWLNEDAETGYEKGNTNRAKLVYSSDSADPVTGYSKPDHIGETAEDKTVVFTYALEVLKVGSNQIPLSGAKFAVYALDENKKYYLAAQKSATNEKMILYKYEQKDSVSADDTDIEYWDMSNLWVNILLNPENTYYEYYRSVIADMFGVSNTDEGMKQYLKQYVFDPPIISYAFTTGENGLFTISGLDQGTYYIEELKAPEEYELLTEPIEVIINPTKVNCQDFTEPGTHSQTSGVLPSLDLSSAKVKDEHDNFVLNENVTKIAQTDAAKGLVRASVQDAQDMKLKVVKHWDEKDNVTNYRPEEITLTLINSGTGRVVKTTEDKDAEVTLNASDADDEGNWIGYFVNLPKQDYSTGYHISEAPVTHYDTTISRIIKEGEGNNYIVEVTNTLTTHVHVYKIWDDADNKDGIRPILLNTSLVMGGATLKDIENHDAIIPLSPNAEGVWSGSVILKGAQYTNLDATEGEITGYSLANKNIAHNADGSISVVFINKHEPAPFESNVSNEHMVNITYTANKVWQWNGSTYGTLPQPRITVSLYGDGAYVTKGDITAGKDPATITFSDLPKYRDNESNEEVIYTVAEEITDPGWIKVGTEWYSLDGKGKYSGSVDGATITNKYQLLQDTTSVSVTKKWKDHQNEDGVRPQFLKLGLFANADDTDPVATVTLTGSINGDEWKDSFSGLPLYAADGTPIGYSTYVVKEAYPTAVDSEGHPTSWGPWVSNGESHTITDNGKEYKYDYSVVTSTP